MYSNNIRIGNYYEILGIGQNANKKEIIRAYRKLALKWHPDKNNHKNSHTNFIKISEAYEILSDSTKKKIYDSQLKYNTSNTYDTSNNMNNKSNETKTSTFRHKNPFDLFRELFPDVDSKILNKCGVLIDKLLNFSIGNILDFSKPVSFLFNSVNTILELSKEENFLLNVMQNYQKFKQTQKYNDDIDNLNQREYKNKTGIETDTETENTETDTETENTETDAETDAETENTETENTETEKIIKIFPPEQIYEFEIDLNDYFNKKSIEIKVPIVDKCYTCSIDHRTGCFICNGDIHYMSERILKIPLNEYELIFRQKGNYLPNYIHPSDLIVYCEDKPDKFYKRLGGFHLYLYVYNEFVISDKDEYIIIFKYLDGNYYRINIPLDLINLMDCSDTIIRVNGFGLPDFNGNHTETQDNIYGDLFIRLTADISYKLNEFENIDKNIEENKKIKKNNIFDIEDDEYNLLQIQELLEKFMK